MDIELGNFLLRLSLTGIVTAVIFFLFYLLLIIWWV